jgi:hypothetical protein
MTNLGLVKNGSVADWKALSITSDLLARKEFEPIRYVVPGLIPEGLTVLGGRPKVGKSWRALDICIGVAGGKRTLQSLEPEAGDVLYLALEDNERRLQSRIRKLGGTFPARLALATERPLLPHGGINIIESWTNEADQPRLVVADTLAHVRPERGGMKPHTRRTMPRSETCNGSPASDSSRSYACTTRARRMRTIGATSSAARLVSPALPTASCCLSPRNCKSGGATSRNGPLG